MTHEVVMLSQTLCGYAAQTSLVKYPKTHSQVSQHINVSIGLERQTHVSSQIENLV